MITVFTNGCFDIVHSGHIQLLRYAKSLGDRLIVAINSDASIRRLKGPNRPIMKQEDRVLLLSELRCVDKVMVFVEDTPEFLIRAIRPDILVKGPEAANAPIPGADFVTKVVVPNWPVEISTSSIIERLKKC